MLIAVPASLRAREMAVTLTQTAAGGGPLVTALLQCLGGSSYITGPSLLGLTMAAEKGRRNQSTGRCNPLWEELEMGLQRKLCPKKI